MAKEGEYLSGRQSRQIAKENRRITDTLEKTRKPAIRFMPSPKKEASLPNSSKATCSPPFWIKA